MPQIESAGGLPVLTSGTTTVYQCQSIAGFAIQLAHRVGIVGFFSFLATLGLLYTGANPHWAITMVFGSADVGCCAALLGRSLLRPSKLRRESTGVLLFNAVLLVLGLQLILLSRLVMIRSAAAAFFRPD